MEGKYIIIDLRTMETMKSENGEVLFFDTEEYARNVCGICEFENAWVMRLIYNHIEEYE